MYHIKIDEDVLADIQAIIEWYSQRKTGLGETFFNLFDSELIYISNNPNMYPVMLN